MVAAGRGEVDNRRRSSGGMQRKVCGVVAVLAVVAVEAVEAVEAVVGGGGAAVAAVVVVPGRRGYHRGVGSDGSSC